MTSSYRVEEPMFKKALKATITQMAKNAGAEELRIDKNDEQNTGVDFKTLTKVNMFDAGIIDPFKVTRLALESAVAVASSLVSIETAITNQDEDKPTTRE